MLLTALVLAIAVPTPNLFPRPSRIQFGTSTVSFARLRVVADAALSEEAEQARTLVGRSNAGEPLRLRLRSNLAALGSEGYELNVTRGGVEIASSQPAGVFYGLQTLRQLAVRKGSRVTVPMVSVSDHPRFPWRGMMLDVSRHFFPKADIEHFLDLLSQYKINTFHWHLVDDGGWRIEIKKYPRLTDLGAWRLPADGTFPEYRGLHFPGRTPGQALYGGYYTQADVKEIVRYASDRHITIVPEIEMPGHNLGATMSYPWLVCSPQLQSGFEKETGFEYPNIFCAGKESTFKFVEDVLDEVMPLFPGKVIHIGGDEVDKYLWDRCDDCRARMKQEGLKNSAELESYFIARVEKYVNAHGKQIIGWDEILEGGLAPNAKVMSWRGEAGGVEAAKQHHEVVMTPWDQCYFDHDNKELPIAVVLGYDPAPPSRGPELAKYVLGAQANIWTERLPTRARIEDRLFPRMVAMAQVLWSGNIESAGSFEERLARHTPLLYRQAPGMHLSGPATPEAVVPPGSPIDLNWTPIDGLTLRFTTNGSEPTADSAVWRGPVRLPLGSVLRAAFTRGRSRVSDTTQVVVGKFTVRQVASPKPGLAYIQAPGAFTSVPDVRGLTAGATGVAGTVGLIGELKENYALRFSGYLRVPRAGRYTLYLTSDDGSNLWLDGIKVIDNDGLHGAVVQAVSLNLPAGLLPLELGYFQATEGQSLSLEISGPGLARQPVSATMLWH